LVQATPGEFAANIYGVLALMRAALGTPGLPDILPTTEADWGKLGACADHHRVTAFLDQCLPADSKTTLPESLQERMRHIRDRLSAHAVVQAQELVRLVQRLESAGITAISVKGPLLSRQLYGDPLLRPSADLDLLLKPADAARADALLREAGYRRLRPDFELTPRQQREYFKVQYEFEYLSPPPPVRVELLWRLEGIVRQTDAWARDNRQELAGHSIRILPPAVNALYLCVHGARHGWCQLFWLLDAALLLRDNHLDWQEILRLARESGNERAVLQAARLASQLLGIAVPAALRPTRAEERTVARLAAEACRQIMLTPAEEHGTAEWFRQLAYRLRLQRGSRRRLTVLRPHLVSLSSWKMVRLPDACFPLYHVLTPFLWAWRKLRTMVRR
jgi:hypothetical protein